MIRVLAGEAKGRGLKVLRGQEIRPTSAKVGAALFNILGDRIPGSVFLDLFAGFGSVGIEALSQGARRAVFVEQRSRAVALIQENLNRCGFFERGELLKGDVFQALSRLQRRKECFDFIFLDPPYEKGLVEKTLSLLAQPPQLIERAGEVIVQHSLREVPMPAYGLLQRKVRKSYGDTQLSFFTLIPHIVETLDDKTWYESDLRHPPPARRGGHERWSR